MKLPASVYSMLGPIPVTKVKGLATDKEAFGIWGTEQRDVKIDADVCLHNQLATLFHECAHIAMTDSGVANYIDDKTQEAVADAIGTYLAAAMLQGYLKFSTPGP